MGKKKREIEEELYQIRWAIRDVSNKLDDLVAAVKELIEVLKVQSRYVEEEEEEW
jgi:hypothetical protein